MQADPDFQRLCQFAEKASAQKDLPLLRAISVDMMKMAPDSPVGPFYNSYVDLIEENYVMSYQMGRRCFEIDPRSETANNIASACIGLGMHDDAERWAKKSLELKRRPEDPASPLANLALLHIYRGEPEQAAKLAAESLAIQDEPEAKETLGYANLMLHNWGAGWDGYDGNLKNKRRDPKPLFDEPHWEGQEDGTLYVRGEQGIGDEISFASVLPDAMKKNRVIFECDPRLEGLFKRSFPDLEIHGTRFEKEYKPWRKERPDWHCVLGTLSRHYRRETKDFPGTPYLVADPDRRLQWRALLDSWGKRPKIGLAWTGGKADTFRTRRSLHLRELAPLLAIDADFVSLEYRSPQYELAKYGYPIRHFARATEAADYDETAALVAELDLVVSVQTAVVHLAGALGKQTLVLVPSKPHWRYGMSGDTMPWYNSVRLFRQPTESDWRTPVFRVKREIELILGNK